MLPDAFAFRVRDTDFKLIDGSVFDIGAKVELHYQPANATGGPEGVFKGEIATLAPQFDRNGVRAHRPRLRPRPPPHARPQDPHLPGHDGLRHRQQGHRRGRPHPRRREHERRLSLRAAEQRDRLGLPVAPRRSASATRSPASTRRSTSARPGQDAGAPVTLEWGDNLKGFFPRATGGPAGQGGPRLRLGPQGGASASSATKDDAKLDSKIVLDRNTRGRRRRTRSSTRSSPPRPRPTRSRSARSTSSPTPGWRPRAAATATRRSAPAPRSASRASARASAATT